VLCAYFALFLLRRIDQLLLAWFGNHLGKMLAPVVVLALFVTLVDQGCGFVDANRHFFDDDHLLRDLSTQDEVLDVNCCGNNPDFNEVIARIESCINSMLR
jgi:hypothetical protein